MRVVPQSSEPSQVIENRVSVVALPRLKSFPGSGMRRALVRSSPPSEWFPPDQSQVHFMEQNFYELDPGLPISADGGLSGLPFIEAVSPSMKAVEAVVRELGHSSVPVLLIGERGTGKQTIAQRIHQNSGRPVDEFQVISCQTLDSPALRLHATRNGVSFYLDEICD